MFVRWRVALEIFLIAPVLSLIACQSNTAIKRYAMTGAVVAVHPDSRTLTVHNDDMPGFMQPMDMDYKLKDGTKMEALKAGDKIKGTIVVEDHSPAQLEGISIIGK